MPTISINKKYFHKLLGKTLSDEEFENLCFDYGLEVEEDKEVETNIKVELPANRYDLLCVEGLANAFQTYLNLNKPKNFTVQAPQHTLTIEESVKKVRPFCVSAIIRDVTFTQEAYDSFIDFQDKLHQNLGRKRTLVSIGTHDYDKTSPPYFYRAKKRDEFSFVSLNQNKEMTGVQMLEFYKNDLNLKSYVDIIQDSDVVPLIMDSKDNILSMPPIINSDLSKISLDTKNIFIDITATDKTKAYMALYVICSAFSIYSSNPCTFEAINIIDGSEQIICPSDLGKKMTVTKEYLESIVGITLKEQEILENLTKMGLNGKILKNNIFEVDIPFYRTDILHQCDIAEDVAIGYGFNNIPFIEASVNCVASQNKLNEMQEFLRQELAFAGFCEALNFSLCSRDDITINLKIDHDERAVEIGNPKTLDFQVGRTTLLPGLLKSLANNKKNKVPFKFFEIGDIILLDKNGNEHETVGAVNERRLAVIYNNSTTSGLEIVHGVLDMIFFKLYKGKKEYQLKKGQKGYFLYDLQCEIFVGSFHLGEMGILHPEVLKKYGINYAGSYLELNFDKLHELMNN